MKKLLSILLAVFILSVMAVPVFAVDSPSATPTFKVEIDSFATGSAVSGSVTGSEEAAYAWVEVDGETVLRLRASEASEYDFTGWVIEGEYEIVSGSLTSDELVIRVLSDVKIEESYDVEGSQGHGSSNDSDKAPETGKSALGFVVLATVGAFVVLVYSRKRIAA